MKQKTNLIFLTLLITISFISVKSAFAKKPEIINAGVALNSQVPEISVVDINGNPQTIKQLSGETGLVLVFFRSADWCPYCKRHLVEINDWNTQLNSIGYKVAAISYDSTEILRKFSNKRNLQYPLLADQNHNTMMALNVLNDEQEPGDDHYGIPFPGVMVIDADAKLVYKYFYKGYKKRVKIKQLFEQLKQGL